MNISTTIYRLFLSWAAFIAAMAACMLQIGTTKAQELLLSTEALYATFSSSGSYIYFKELGGMARVTRLTQPLESETFPCPYCAEASFSEDDSVLSIVHPQPFSGGLTGSRIVTVRRHGGEEIASFPSAMDFTNRAWLQDLRRLPGGKSYLCFADYVQIRTYSTETGKPQMQSELISSGVAALSASSSAGRIVAGAENGAIYIWSLEDLSLVARLTNYVGFTSFAAISEDGRTLHVGAKDGYLRRLSYGDWIEHIKIDTLQKGVTELAVDAEQTIVLTRGFDGTVKAWTARDFRPLFTVQVSDPAPSYYSYQDYFRVRISLDGSMFATAGTDYAAKLFSLSLRITQAERDGNDVRLEWCGGKAPFKLQSRGSLTQGDWQDVGGIQTSRRLSAPMKGNQFYRVVQAGSAE